MMQDKGMSLKSLMELPFMGRTRIVAGATGINKPVHNVNIMVDLDILKWVKAGDLLFTTAYVFKQETLEATKAMFKEFADKGLAGLCIKVYPYINALDPELIALADDLSLPILDVDYEVSFNDIMTPIYRQLIDKQAWMLDKVEAVHKETMHILLKGGNSHDIVDMLTAHLEHPTFYLDYQFDEVVEPSQCLECYKELTHAYLASKRMSRGRKKTDSVLVDDVAIERVFIPVLVKDEVHGHLIVYGAKRSIDNVDILSLESAASLVAIESLKKLSIKEVENKYKAEFFDDLIALDPIRRSKAMERASNYGFKEEGTFSIMSLALADEPAGVKSIARGQKMTKMIYLLELMLMNQELTYLISTKDNHVNLLFMWRDKDHFNKRSNEVVELIENAVKGKFSSQYTIGVGRVYQGIEHTHYSLADAVKAIELSGIQGVHVIRFDQLGIYKLLSHPALSGELMEFYQATLEPLVQYDNKRDTDLVKTLEIYFEMNGNLKKMSEHLYTHYNTILYRISRIKEITEKNLDNEHDRYGLQTALKIKKILELKR